MKTKKYWPLVLGIILCFVLLSLGVPAGVDSFQEQEYNHEIYTLEGLKGVNVRVEHLLLSAFEMDTLRRNPLIVDDLQVQAKHALRRARIRVVESPSQNPEIAELVITVNTWERTLISEVIVQVKTELYQLAELVRSNRLRIMVPTWPVDMRIREVEMTEVIDVHKMRSIVETEVERQIKLFSKDYLRANPKLMHMMAGTIRYLDFEGGFFGIVSDCGEHYNPVNLSAEYAKDGLRVRFQVKEIAQTARHRVAIARWGKIVEIVKIEKL
ncbi:MAG: hypothetical protein FVQ85_03250 [Planctomycetes bacterium]|nr:hypothetical protein [Planctomycetota bacterium]